MSDEEPIDDTLEDNSDEVTQDTSENQDVPADTPSDNDDETPIPGAYCTREEVNSLFGDISDDVSDELFVTAIKNSTAWISSNLARQYVPIPVIVSNTTDDATTISETTVSIETGNGLNIGPDSDANTLRTAAIYYAASDILLALYHGDTLPVQYDVWFQKAQDFLDAYIDAYKKSEADEADLVAHQMVKHSHGLTYNQKRGRGRRWAR